MIDDRLVAGRYRLMKQLGSGGMGVVWQAHDERLDRTVAVKQLLLPAGLTGPEADEVKRLAMREGRIAARLQHPNLIMVYDVTEDDDGHPYLIMEYLPSRSLSEVLAEQGTLPPAEAARIGAQAAAALAAAHAAGVVHRDVKPGNVLLGDPEEPGDGATGPVKITDFGISRAVEDVTTTSTGIITGTPAYLSPEVAKGDRATFSSDVFSLGSTLYTAIEGTPPFGTADNAMALLYRVASNQITPPQRAGAMTDVLLRLLRTDPAERPTMAEATEALTAAAGVAAAAARTTAPIPDAGHRPTAVLEPVPAAPAPRTPTARQPAPAVLPPVTGTPTRPPLSAYPPPRPPQQPRRGRGRAPLVAVAIIALLAIAGVVLASQLNDDDPGSPTTGPSTSAGETTPAGTTAPVQPVPTGGGDGEDEDDGPTATTEQSATTTEAPTSQPPSSSTPAQSVTDYYALMPSNPDAGWTRLTERYQQNPGGGFDGYRNFWGQMQSVQVSEVTGAGENTVEATVVYSFKTGKVVQERHSYTLVPSDRGWLIDTSTVLSSRTQ